MTLSSKKASVFSCLGSAFEYYDFVIYGLLSSFMAPLFFGQTGSLPSVLKSLLIFTLGYIARPVGGLLFGMHADRFGRKNALILSMLLMAGSTLLMSLLPTTASVGWVAPLLLMLCRITQGLSFGAELPGAITFISEYNERKKRGLQCSLVIASTSIGTIFASLLLMLLTSTLSASAMQLWGWRLPFLVGGAFALFCGWMRSQIAETPAFSSVQNQRRALPPLLGPLRELRSKYKKEFAIAVSLNLLTATLIILNIYYSTFLKSYFGHAPDQVFKAMTLSLVLTLPLLPLSGALGDRFTPRRVLKILLLSYPLLGFIGISLPYSHTFSALLLFFLLNQFFISTMIVNILSITSTLFPTEIRFTALGLSYNLAFILAALLPIALTSMVHADLFTVASFGLVLGVSILALFSLRTLRPLKLSSLS